MIFIIFFLNLKHSLQISFSILEKHLMLTSKIYLMCSLPSEATENQAVIENIYLKLPILILSHHI